MTDHDSGRDLHDLIERSLTDLPTPTARLHDGALLQGRPLRRRRRAVAGLGGVAALAALAAVALPFVGGTGPTAGDTAVEPPPVHQPTVSTAPFVDHAGWWDAPVGTMRARLATLLPSDVEITAYEKVNDDHAPGQTDVWSGVFRGTLRDATDVGPGSVEIMLSELPSDPAARADVRAQHLTCDLDDWSFVELDGPVKCETSMMRAGLPQERTITYTDQGVTYTEVRRWTDSGEIYAAVANSTDRKWGPPASAVRAPLTLPELQAVVDNPVWIGSEG